MSYLTVPLHHVAANHPTKKYSMYGHIVKLAEAEKKGIEAAGGKVDVYQYVPIIILLAVPR